MECAIVGTLLLDKLSTAEIRLSIQHGLEKERLSHLVRATVQAFFSTCLRKSQAISCCKESFKLDLESAGLQSKSQRHSYHRGRQRDHEWISSHRRSGKGPPAEC
jgi:hypothetical protein